MRSVIYGLSVQRLLVLVFLSAVSGRAWPPWNPYGSPPHQHYYNHPTGSLHHPEPNSNPHLSSLLQQHDPEPLPKQIERDLFDPLSDTDFSSPVLVPERPPYKGTSSYGGRLWSPPDASAPRSKRPSVLGLDNMEYAASILDRGKEQGTMGTPLVQATPPSGRRRPPGRQPPARQRLGGSLRMSSQSGRLSTSLGVSGLSRMVQDQRRIQLEKMLKDMRNRGR